MLIDIPDEYVSMTVGDVCKKLGLVVSPVPAPPVPSPAPAPAPAPVLQFSDFMGANTISQGDIARQQFGLGWNRVPARWSVVQAGGPVAWDWSQTDQWVSWWDAAHTVLDLAFTPHWASTGDDKAAPRSVSDWVNFVASAVGRYPAIKYFQVWNEPTSNAGYWRGSDHQFVDLIYLPAAKLLRQVGKKVVFGGWPAGDSVDRYKAMLAYNGCLEATDVLDYHYAGLDGFKALAAYGKPVWQTEIGNQTGSYLTDQVGVMLPWLLAQGWTNPDYYRIFWYPFRGSLTGQEGLLLPDNTTLTANGTQLAALAKKYAKGIQ